MDDRTSVSPPPPYTAKPPPSLRTAPFYIQPSSYASEVEDSDDDEPPSSNTPIITINASTTLSGTGNILAGENTANMRLAGSIAHALCGNLSSCLANRRSLSVHIDCGIKLVGDRNVIGKISPRALPHSKHNEQPKISVASAGGPHTSDASSRATAHADAASVAAAKVLVELAGNKRRVVASEGYGCEDSVDVRPTKRCRGETTSED